MLRPTRGRGAILGLVLLCLAAFPAPAGAGSGYYTQGNPSLSVRSGPGTSYSRTGSLPYGTHINIACQDSGSSVGGSTIWDRLDSGGWVSDYYVSGTPYGKFDSRLPRCSQPAPAPSSSREDRAVAWARGQLGQTHQPSGQPWNGWCGRFVANAFGRSNSGYASAAAQYRDLSNRGLVHRGDTNVPFGALAFSGGTDANGHVMISIGGGRYITTAEQIKEVGLSYGGQYWGWAWANPEWPGR